MPTSLSDEIVLRLEAAILDGTYPPGAHLVQDELCARFGVSRTPIRQALRDLQARRLVVIVPNKGAVVRIPTRQEAAEVYGIRTRLEAYAAELAASAQDLEAFERMRHAHETVVQLVVPFRHFEDVGSALQARIHRANRDFHESMWAAAGNGLLAATLGQLERSFPTEYVAYGIRSGDESRAINVDEHAGILAALLEGDREAAGALCGAHVEHLGATTVRFLAERGLLGNGDPGGAGR